MGYDFCGFFQKKDENTNQYGDPFYFISLDEPYGSLLFHWLCGDGDNIYEIDSISKPRGIPDDLKDKIMNNAFCADNYIDKTIYIGDHSYSWVTSTEILNSIDFFSKKLKHYYVIPKRVYKLWKKTDGKKLVFGYNVKDKNGTKTGDVCCYLDLSVYLKDFIDMIQLIHDELGEVRLSFGFDYI